VSQPDFTACVEVLHKACRQPEFDAASALSLLNLFYEGMRERRWREMMAVGFQNVDYGASDGVTIATLAGLYCEFTGRKPRGLSVDPHADDWRRYPANPFPELIQKFFAALGRPLGNEHLHKMIKAARKQVPEAFRTKQ
jgi:hypothetical protein